MLPHTKSMSKYRLLFMVWKSGLKPRDEKNGLPFFKSGWVGFLASSSSSRQDKV